MKVQKINLNKIDVPGNIDMVIGCKDFREKIKGDGLLMYVTKKDNGRYWCVHGAARLRALKASNRKEIECAVI